MLTRSPWVIAAQVANAKVLMVGAGGIGCELLKTLVLTGFRTIEVVSTQQPWQCSSSVRGW